MKLFQNLNNGQKTVRKIAEDIEMSYSSYQEILTKHLDMSSQKGCKIGKAIHKYVSYGNAPAHYTTLLIYQFIKTLQTQFRYFTSIIS